MNHYQHLISEPAQLTYCTRCGTPVIRAHAGGLDIACDTTPLTTASEALALLNNKITVELFVYLNGTVELVPRDIDHIRADRDTPVLAKHRCTGQTLTPKQVRDLPPATPFRVTRPRSSYVGDSPPF